MINNFNPLVSIIIPTFNRCHLVGKTIDSVINQSYDNKEIIVVDDCSTDDTEKYLNNKYHEKIHYIRLDKNKGVQNASNIGFDHSSGIFLAFPGDDDIWTDKDKLKKQISIFLNDLKLKFGVVTSSIRIIRNENIINKYIRKPKNLLSNLMAGNDCVYGSAALIRKSSFVEAGKFDSHLKKGTDSDVFRRIVLKGYDIHFINQIMIDYSETEKIRMSNFTIDNLNENIKAHFYKLEKYSLYYKKNPKVKSLLLSYIADNYFILAKKSRIYKNLYLSQSFYLKSLHINYLSIRVAYKLLKVILLLVLRKL